MTLAAKSRTDSTRLLVVLKRDQHAVLKALSQTTGAPMNYHVRLALDEYLARQRPTKRRK